MALAKTQLHSDPDMTPDARTPNVSSTGLPGGSSRKHVTSGLGRSHGPDGRLEGEDGGVGWDAVERRLSGMEKHPNGPHLNGVQNTVSPLDDCTWTTRSPVLIYQMRCSTDCCKTDPGLEDLADLGLVKVDWLS